MKNKIQLFILGISLVLLFAGIQMVSAELVEERIPAGTEITTPVSFSVSWDSFEELELVEPVVNYWGIFISRYGTCGELINPICVATSTKSKTFIFDLYVGCGYDYVAIAGGDTLEVCQDYVDAFLGAEFEVCGSPGCFIITGEEETRGGVIILPEGALASTTAYIGDLIGSISGFLWLIIGLPLGFWIINETIKLITPKKVKIRK